MKNLAYISIACLMLLAASAPIYAQELATEGPFEVECGSILEGELTSNYQVNYYRINLAPGDAVNVSLTPLGSGLQTNILLTGPTGLGLAMGSGGVESDGDL